jgi:four helix bundle protein
MGNINGLTAYEKAFSFAMEIFEETRFFPKEERYALIDQMRRSSRSVCSNIGEAYRKRQYESYFVSKVSDADMENTETQVWLDFAYSCGYLDNEKYNDFFSKTDENRKTDLPHD